MGNRQKSFRVVDEPRSDVARRVSLGSRPFADAGRQLLNVRLIETHEIAVQLRANEPAERAHR